MLNRKDLEKFRVILGFNIGQLEKDYLQHLFLLFLSRNIKDELVFKGGTAMQKVYSLNRFSEDLDFTLVKEINTEKLIEKISSNITNFGLTTKYELINTKKGKNYRLRIKGPLFDGTEKTIASLRIEISERKDIILTPDLKVIIPIYTDMQPYIVLVMSIKEILAEKVRAILQREKARDIFDLFFLLKKGASVDYELIQKKNDIYNVKFTKKLFFERLELGENIWKEELSRYVTLLPNFSEVIHEIKRHFV